MALSDHLKSMGARRPKSRTEPLWKGPQSNDDLGGISFSLLSRYLSCKERFRIQTIEGLAPAPTFHAPMDFGNMWHACEEAWAKTPRPDSREASDGKYLSWPQSLKNCTQEMCKRYQSQQQQIYHWYEICRAEFPLYREHWQHHPDTKDREPIVQEKVFKVFYKLPSGREVYLRGKWDSIDVVDKAIWIQENKTKSQIDQRKLTRQLSYDLQSMIYVVALGEQQDSDFWNRSNKKWRGLPIKGIRYNVVRRSAHKSSESMVKKILEDKDNGRIGEWFARWNIEISGKDITKFRIECLDPILENLYDDYEWWQYCFENKKSPFSYTDRGIRFLHHQQRHYRHPYGVRNILDEGGSSDLDNYLDTGSEVGLVRLDTLFPELS